MVASRSAESASKKSGNAERGARERIGRRRWREAAGDERWAAAISPHAPVHQRRKPNTRPSSKYGEADNSRRGNKKRAHRESRPCRARTSLHTETRKTKKCRPTQLELKAAYIKATHPYTDVAHLGRHVRREAAHVERGTRRRTSCPRIETGKKKKKTRRSECAQKRKKQKAQQRAGRSHRRASGETHAPLTFLLFSWGVGKVCNCSSQGRRRR